MLQVETMTQDPIGQLLLNEKPAKALTTLQNKRINAKNQKCVSDLAKQINSTNAHTVKIVNKLEEYGLVKSQRKGRKKHLDLTEKGEKYAESLELIVPKQQFQDAVLGTSY